MGSCQAESSDSQEPLQRAATAVLRMNRAAAPALGRSLVPARRAQAGPVPVPPAAVRRGQSAAGGTPDALDSELQAVTQAVEARAAASGSNHLKPLWAFLLV